MQRIKEIVPKPIFINKFGESVDLRDVYQGGHAFLLASGPSTNHMDLRDLTKPGIFVMCMNNSFTAPRFSKEPFHLRPNAWCCVDPPDRFLLSMHRDAQVMKFYPRGFHGKVLWDAEKYVESQYKVGDCPNIIEFPRNNVFNKKEWLSQDSLNWGNHKDSSVISPKTGKKINGKRSVMLPSMKILVMLGFKHIYLVGCDFNMQPGKPYAFEQEKHPGGCKSNNNSYEGLNAYFDILRPMLESVGVKVYNTNPDSGLKSFDFLDYNEAIKQALEYYNVDPDKETTKQMYDDLKDKRNMGIKAKLKLGAMKGSGLTIKDLMKHLKKK